MQMMRTMAGTHLTVCGTVFSHRCQYVSISLTACVQDLDHEGLAPQDSDTGSNAVLNVPKHPIFPALELTFAIEHVASGLCRIWSMRALRGQTPTPAAMLR